MNDAPAPVSENRSLRTARFANQWHRFKNQMRRRWWLLPLLVFLALGIQAWRLWSAPPAFTSYGKMIVNFKVTTATGAGTTFTEEWSQFLGTQVMLMKSGTVLNRAAQRVRDLKPDLKPAPLQPIEITVLPKTTIFLLRLTGEDPEYTTAYLQAVMDEYIALKDEMLVTASGKTLAGIMSELTRLEKDLKRGEDELLAFQSSNSVVFLQEQGNSAAVYLDRLNRQLASLQSELQLLNSLTLDQNLERQARPGAGEGGADPLAGLTAADANYFKIRQEILLLKARQQELGEFLRPRHPKMEKLAQEIAEKERLLAIYREQSQEQLQNRTEAIGIQIEALRKDIAEWEARTLDSSRKMAEYQKIKANNARLQSLYDRLQATMQTLSTDKDIRPETVTILERASTALPNTEDAVQSLLIAAGLGLLAALGLLLLLDRFDDRITSFTDLQDIFDEPVLCQVPREIVLNENGKLDLIHPNDERHAFAESYRNLRSSLLYMGEGNKLPKLLVVTSSIPGEGKSVTAANLGITLAEAGGKVLLVDADLRKGTLHEYFQLSAGPGLTEALTGETNWTQVVHPTNTPGVAVLTRGRTARNPSELFLGPATKKFLAEVTAAYDIVLLDSAPVMAADDVATLAPQTEGAVFVLRANYTSARVARAALDLLYQRRVKVLGLALNAVAADSSEYYYYKYKSYYSDTPKRA